MSDPNTPDIERFEPLPDKRPSWKGALRGAAIADGDSATPERWLEQGTVVELEPEPETERAVDPPSSPGGGFGRGVVAAVFAASLIGAIVGAAGTFAALRSSGALDSATAASASAASATTGTAAKLVIESDASTVIAAVAAVDPAVVQIVTTDSAGNTGVGSGIVYDSRGWILTNKHVVQGVASLTVRLKDDRRVPGTIYGLDTLTDLAIVKIDAVAGLAVAPIGSSSSLQVGELAIAIGSPLGIDYANSVTTGIVSALGRDISVLSDDPAVKTPTSLHGLIQTDAAINPGNSGGPLVNAAGKVVGVTTAAAPTSQGIGFAIPIDVAKPIMQQALAGEPLSRPFIGVAFATITRGLKDQNKLPLDQGAWVHAEDAAGNSIDAVVPGSPGDLAGIKTGDIITAVEGQAIDSSHQLGDVLVQYAPGRTVSVEIYRAGSYLTLKVTLGTRPTTLS
jgi:S1-C subfamily serine protease